MERLDDLEINDFKIFQDDEKFCFGIDAVLLANFALKGINNCKDKIYMADLCSGAIPIPLIIYAKKNENLNICIDAFDIDEEQLQLAKKSINYNLKFSKGILDDISIINLDINDIVDNKHKYLDYYNKYDVITCNPPYIKNDCGEFNKNDNIKISKHETNLKFEKLCKIVSALLKSNKRFYLVHRTNRLSEIISILKKYRLELKKIQFVYPNINKQSNLFLLEAVKSAKEETKVLEPIIFFDKKGNWTDEVLEIYGK